DYRSSLRAEILAHEPGSCGRLQKCAAGFRKKPWIGTLSQRNTSLREWFKDLPLKLRRPPCTVLPQPGQPFSYRRIAPGKGCKQLRVAFGQGLCLGAARLDLVLRRPLDVLQQAGPPFFTFLL